MKVVALSHGWGLQRGKRFRRLTTRDSVGCLKGQPAMWRTRKLAVQMALPGETPVRIAAWYEVRRVAIAGVQAEAKR